MGSPWTPFKKAKWLLCSFCLQMDHCLQLCPFTRPGAEAWRKAVMYCLGFSSFLRSSYITDLLCNTAVGVLRKLACTLDKKLNYSKGHLESSRPGDTEEWSAPHPTGHGLVAEKFPLWKSHEPPISWASVFGEHCRPLEGPWLPLGKVKNMTPLQQRHQTAVWGEETKRWEAGLHN